MDRKLVKEMTGHASNAVDKYQQTGDHQRKLISEVLAGNTSTISVPPPLQSEQNSEQKTAMIELKANQPSAGEVKKANVHNVWGDGNVGDMINSLIESIKSDGKSKICIKIEISKE